MVAVICVVESILKAVLAPWTVTFVAKTKSCR
jgi:hypothetical protein